MELKRAVRALFPELEELEYVDFRGFSPPYPEFIQAFAESGKKSLPEFQKFVEEKIGEKAGKEIVGRVLLALFQYLLIRYRRFGDYSTVKPMVKLFVTMKGWLLENGFKGDWERVLSSFIGYLVTFMPLILEKEDCDVSVPYLITIARLAREASEIFESDYYDELLGRSLELIQKLSEKCGVPSELVEKKNGNCHSPMSETSA